MAKAPTPPAEPTTYAPSGRNNAAATETYDYGDRISDSYRLGWMGQLLAKGRVEAKAWQEASPGFDGLDHIPHGYEIYADAFANAGTDEEIAQIKHEIDLNLGARIRREQLSTAQALGDDVVTGIVDPLNLIPIAAVEGQGVKMGAIRGAASLGAVGGTTAVLTSAADPTSSREEGAIGAATSIVFGGVLGGIAGRATGRAVARTRLELPGGPGRITSPFGLRSKPNAKASSNHKGVDIGYADGTPLRAQADGIVHVKRTGLGGNEVHIDYGNGVEVAMLHLRDGVPVREGQHVRRGDLVGAVGATGNATGPHLHYQVKINGRVVDPMGRVEVGAQVSSPQAVHDLAAGFSVPDSVVVNGVDMPVHTRDGLGQPRVVFGSAGSLVDNVVDEVGTDFGNGGVRGSDEELIAQYLKNGGDVLSVPRNRRTRDPRRWKDGDVPTVSTPKEATIDNPAKLAAVGRRLDARLDELEAHPRFNPNTRLTKKWLADVSDELNLQPDKIAALVGDRVEIGSPTKGDVIKLLRGRAKWMVDQVTDTGQLMDGLDENGEPVYVERPGLALEAEDHVRGNWTRQLDDNDLEIQAQDRASRRVQHDDGEIRPLHTDKPMTAAERARWRVTPASVAETELNDAEPALNGMYLDPQEVLAGYRDRQWIGEPLPGGKVIEAGDITSPADWFQFSVNRAIALEEQGDIAKANEAALKATREESGPFVPDGKLRDIAIAASPMRQMKSLVPHEADIQRSLYKLAGDGAVLLTANKGGAAAAPGGSVMMRTAQWLRHLYPIREAIRHSYAEERGSVLGRNRLINELKILRRRGLGFSDGLDAHRREVGRAIVGFEDVGPGAVKAAQVWVKVMELVEKGAREAGLFTDSQRLQGLADRAETTANKLAARVEGMRARGMPDESIRLMEEVAHDATQRASAARAMADAPLASRFETNHYSRIWHKGALLDDPEGAIDALEIAYARNGDGNPRASAEGAYQFLIEDPEGEMHAPGTPGFVKARSIPITNKEAWKWIVQDPETVAMVYLRRMGTSIEMTRMFGDPFGLAEIDRLTADLVERGVEPDRIRQAVQVYEDARDRVAGGFHAKDPMSWDNRATRVLRNLTQLELMGGSLRSQISDIGRVILTQGLGVKFLLGRKNAQPGLLAAAIAQISGDVSKFSPGGISKEAGEAMEIVISRAAMRLIEADDALVVTGQSGIERGLAAAVTPFHMASLLLPFTVILKEWDGVLAAHNILRDSELVASHRPSGIPKVPLNLAGKHEFKTGHPVEVEALHGSTEDAPLEEFSFDYAGVHTGAESAKKAFWFTSRKGSADYYANSVTREVNMYRHDGLAAKGAPGWRAKTNPMVHERVIRFENPMVVDMKNSVYREESFSEMLDRAKEGGHDGLILQRAFDSGETSKIDVYFDAIMGTGAGFRFKGETLYAAFDPKMIRHGPLGYEAPAKGHDEAVKRLAMVGIEPEMAARLASMPTEKGISGLNLVNIEKWHELEGGSEAAQHMLGAVYGEVRRGVVTPGPLDKPAIADGVMHTAKGGREHQQLIDEQSQRVLDLRGELAGVASLDDSHPAKAGILEALREATGELTQLKRNRGRAGRMEMPLLSTPFFLKSFGLAAGGKGLHGLLSGVDRNRLGGLLSLLMAGYVSWYWKMNGNVKDVPYGEQLAEAFLASGIPAWLGDLSTSIDTALNTHMVPGNTDFDPEGKTIADEAGGVTPVATMFDRLLAPFLSEDQDDRAHDIRKAIPLNNAVYLKGLFDRLEGAIDGEDDQKASWKAGTAAAASGEHQEAQAQVQGNGIDYGRIMAPEPKAPPKDVATSIEIGNITDDPAILDNIEVLMDAVTDDSSRKAILKRAAAKAKKAKGRHRRQRAHKSNLTSGVE